MITGLVIAGVWVGCGWMGSKIDERFYGENFWSLGGKRVVPLAFHYLFGPLGLLCGLIILR